MGSIIVNGANGFVVATNNDGGVTNSIPLNISRVTLQANAAGSVMVGGQIGNASSTFTRLVASGTGSVFYPGTSFAVLGSTVVLGAGGTIGSSAAPLLVNSPNVNVINAGGNVTITDFSNGATLTTTPVGGALSFVGTGFIEVLSAFTSLGNVSIVNSSALGVPNGSINLDGAITAPTISLTTNGTGNLNTIGTGQAIAPTVNLTIQGSGAIGGVNPFSIAATNVAPTTTGLVNISDNQSMTLTGSGISAASKVSLSTTNNGNIVVHGQIGNDSTGAVTISAGGSGSITANADIHGNALVLTSGTGAIGVRAVITPADIKGVPLAAKFDIRALKLRAALDWKFDEYDPEKPAPRGKSRHSLLGRSRHQRGAAVDEAKRRPRLCLYRQPRPT